MTDIRLENDSLRVDINPQGGVLWRAYAKAGDRLTPLMREPPPGPGRDIGGAACFPLVPFGNRISGNRFGFEGREHLLEPNMSWDKHYLHGDGWISIWHVETQASDEVRLALSHRATGTPYSYDAAQTVRITGPTLTLSLEVTNKGESALPFGLGWHPFFPLTPQTRLTAPASSYWEEGEHWLPTVQKPLVADLDFSAGAGLPRRWVNNGFEGWRGEARIDWPEHNLRLAIAADALFSRYFVFVSDPAFNPGYAFDFFCFEPMSHSANGHNLPGSGGLVTLAPGETLAGSVRMMWENIDPKR